MTNTLIKQNISWETFDVGDIEDYRDTIRYSYETILMGNDDYIPSLDYFFHEDDRIYWELKIPIMQLFTFGELITFPNEEEQDMVNNGFEWYGESLDRDIKLSLIQDHYFFIDEYSEFVNIPLVTTW